MIRHYSLMSMGQRWGIQTTEFWYHQLRKRYKEEPHQIGSRSWFYTHLNPSTELYQPIQRSYCLSQLHLVVKFPARLRLTQKRGCTQEQILCFDSYCRFYRIWWCSGFCRGSFDVVFGVLQAEVNTSKGICTFLLTRPSRLAEQG